MLLQQVATVARISGLRFFPFERIYQITCVSFSPIRFFTLIETAATKRILKLGGAGQMYPDHCTWNNSVPTSCFFELLPFVIGYYTRLTHSAFGEVDTWQIFRSHVIINIGKSFV